MLRNLLVAGSLLSVLVSSLLQPHIPVTASAVTAFDQRESLDAYPLKEVESIRAESRAMPVTTMVRESPTTTPIGGNSAVPNRPVFISTARMAAIRNAIQQQHSPNYDAYRMNLLGECRSALGAGEHAPSTLYVPGYYVDRVGHGAAKAAIRIDANNVYALGLCYRITNDNRYAEAAARIIKAWANNVTSINTADDTTLVLSYHFPAMIFGADLIRSSSAYKVVDKAFLDLLQRLMIHGSSIDRISRAGCGYIKQGLATNNWSDWGTVLTISIGAFTNDDALFNKAVEKWKSNIAYQVDAAGNLPMEGRRNTCTGDAGIGYTNFAMQALSITAEIAANNGVDLFHYTINGDNPYLRAWNRTALVVHYPPAFPFSKRNEADYVRFRYDIAWFEIANSYFPNADAAWTLATFRPVISREVLRYATVTHGQLLPTSIQTSATGTITHEFWLNQNRAIDDLQRITVLPTGSNQLTSFEGPTHWNSNYVSRIRGYLIPPTTGAYTFWIASDDFSHLYLSSDADPANKREIARIDEWTSSRQWDKFSTQRSMMVQLQAGQRYYIEATHVQGIGNDNLAVGWAKPGQDTDQPSEIIPGNALAPYQP